MRHKVNEIYRKICALIILCYLSVTSINADNRDPLWDTQNEFNKQGYNLKGPVYSVSTKSMYPIIELGEVVDTRINTIDSLVFDEKGNIAKRFDYSDDLKEITYSIGTDTVMYTILKEYGTQDIMSVIYIRDASNRITEVRRHKNNKLDSRRIFEYAPTGYGSIYYHDGSKEDVYLKEGNTFEQSLSVGVASGKFNKDGQVASIKKSAPFIADLTTYYTYNQNGDIIKENGNIRIGNKLSGTAVQNESGTRYEYVYDDHGNWTEKREYVDGKLKKEYEKREIIYKTPEEIVRERKAEEERIRLFENELRKKGEDLAKKFIDGRLDELKEFLVYNANDHIRKSSPIKAFSVDDDCYSFDLTNGEHIENVRFYNVNVTEYHPEYRKNLLSEDLHTVLVPEYTKEGPKWYIVRYNAGTDFNLTLTDSIDWISLYYKNFTSRSKSDDEAINRVWTEELWKQWDSSDYSNLKTRIYNNNITVCANELVDAYEKGFVSPRTSDKKKEEEYIKAYQEYKAEEKRKQLCVLAHQAAKISNDKPVGDKLKKFVGDLSGYYFKKKDNSEIINPIFETHLSGRGVSVYLSSDLSVAMVYKQTYEGYFVFIIELDGDNLESVNYFQLKGKDLNKFNFPGRVKYNYQTHYL